ncbi:MAG: hypothetical protein LBT66_01525 [Methanobrevibacter sp.]|jgi:hypothetical protein|nr:hypothetical protein [Candidatus Methanovirga meridionalis]
MAKNDGGEGGICCGAVIVILVVGWIIGLVGWFWFLIICIFIIALVVLYYIGDNTEKHEAENKNMADHGNGANYGAENEIKTVYASDIKINAENGFKPEDEINAKDTFNYKYVKNENCPKCGALVSSNAIFCGKCGCKLEEDNLEPESIKTSFSNNIPSLKTYEKEIHELESIYQSKEKIALEIIEKRFTPPQLTYDRFIGIINNCNQIFYKQSESARNIIEVATKHVPKIDEELKKRLNTLKSLIEKLDDLITELAINSDDQSYSTEVKDLLEEMQDLVDSIKEYN